MIKTEIERELLRSIDRAYQSIEKALALGDYREGLIEAKFELKQTLKRNDAFLHDTPLIGS
jgi:hypothetical protein